MLPQLRAAFITADAFIVGFAEKKDSIKKASRRYQPNSSVRLLVVKRVTQFTRNESKRNGSGRDWLEKQINAGTVQEEDVRPLGEHISPDGQTAANLINARMPPCCI